jgi:uncharacterized membrane protein
MAFCSKCGTQLQEGSGFCAACGAPVPGQPTTQVTGAAPSGMADNVAAALSYIWIIGLIFLFIDPYKTNRFVRFHSFQSVFYAAACFAFWIVLHIIAAATAGIAWLLLGPLALLIWLGLFVFWIFLIVKAYNNQQYKAPFIGDLAARQVANI